MKFDYDFMLLLMIFLRMSGCILFNPILGRSNIPFIIRTGIALMLSLFTYPLVPAQSFEIASFPAFILSGVKELTVGFLVGFILQLFLSVIVMGGETIDFQIGLSMSKVYDPQSNVSMPLSASIINVMFILMFFATNSHLTLMKIFVKFGAIVPYGDQLISADAYKYVAGLFSLMLIYAIKLALPFIAVQMISEIGVGLIMRAVPQIDIFSVEVQVKLLIGFLAMLILVPSFASFLDKMISLLFDNISHVFGMLT